MDINVNKTYMTTDIATKIVMVVFEKLGGSNLIALVEEPRETIERKGYWEHAWIVAWHRPGRGPMAGEDEFGTHRVHVNSTGEVAAFDGHYQQSRESALLDMYDRANIDMRRD